MVLAHGEVRRDADAKPKLSGASTYASRLKLAKSLPGTEHGDKREGDGVATGELERYENLEYKCIASA